MSRWMFVVAATALLFATVTCFAQTNNLLTNPGFESDDGSIHYVSPSGSHMFPYTTWGTAANDIQSAVDVAGEGDTVLVTNGLYGTGSTRTPGFASMNRVCITNAITVRSVNGPEATIISGGWESVGTGSVEAIRCVFMATNSVLDGFTLTNGCATGKGGGALCVGGGLLINCTVSGNIATRTGGGVNGGNLENCRLIGNTTTNYGGGVAYAKLNRCTLSENTAIWGGGAFMGTLSNCLLSGNSAVAGGGAQYATLFNCTLTSNTASVAGGGATSCTLTDCILIGNSAVSSGGGAQYGYLYNCLLVGNTANRGGGVSGGYAVRNCTLTDNSASLDGGGTYGVGGSALANCIIWGNHCTNNNNRANYANGYPIYSCTSPMPMPVPYPTGSNIVADPLFVDPANGNYQLQPGSPCYNMGNNIYAPTNVSPCDLAGKPRILFGTVDMGSYEFSQPCVLDKQSELIEYPDRYEIRYTLSLTNNAGTNAYIYAQDVLPSSLAFLCFESNSNRWGYWVDHEVISYDSFRDPFFSGGVFSVTFLARVIRNRGTIAITNVMTVGSHLDYGSEYQRVSNTIYLPDHDGDEISDLDDPDDDNDGMADYWEIYYGLDPLNPDDADEDPDGDGRTNLVEFQDHTDPFVVDGPADGQYCLVDNRDPNCSDLTGFPFRTIQAAMHVVMPNEPIEVADGVYTGNYFLARDLDLRGSDATFIESASTTTIFNIPAGISASLSDLRFWNMTNEAPPVIINAGHVVLSNLVVSGCVNKAEYYHGGTGGSFIRGGRGILRNETGATMRIHSSTFDGNYSSGRALYNTRAYGGAICNYGLLQVSESTFSSNLCDSGWNYHVPLPSYGGAIYNGGTAEIDACTFYGNRVVGGSCSRQPVGLPGYGGAICSHGPLTITRSTLSGNSAESHFIAPGIGGAIYSSVGAVSVDSCTIIGNQAGLGGGISGSNMVIRNTILSGNSAEVGPDAHGTLVSAGYNLIGSMSNLTLLGETNTVLLNVDPCLAPLADNGGPTWTCALRVGSPAIDAGSCGGGGTNVGMTVDQRGVIRPMDWTNVPNAYDGCDIGAYEFDIRDNDGDGLFNDWERQYGLDPDAAGDGDIDVDGDGLSACCENSYQTDPTCSDTDADGMSDGDEVRAGMSPTDSNSVFKVKEVVSRTDGNEIRWNSAGDKTYTIYRAANLADGFTYEVASGIPATPPINTYIDTTAPDEGMSFYRVAVDN